MQLCSCAVGVQFCSSSVAQLCSCADVQLCSCVVVQLCSCAVAQLLCSCGVDNTVTSTQTPSIMCNCPVRYRFRMDSNWRGDLNMLNSSRFIQSFLSPVNSSRFFQSFFKHGQLVFLHLMFSLIWSTNIFSKNIKL